MKFERSQFKNNISFTVLNYCVAFPIPFTRMDPNNDLYKWFLMHYDRKLEMVNINICKNL